MKISYVSDLHLEFSDYPEILEKDEGGDVLILAGDIFVASYFREDRTDKAATKQKKIAAKLKKDLFDKYDDILYIMGNHEHYHGMYSKTKALLFRAMNNLGVIDKVTVLENDHIVIDDIPFIGATLWSDFQKNDDLCKFACERGMNDFHVIGSLDVEDFTYFNRYDKRTITPDFILKEHNKSLEFISDMTKFYSSRKCVVITHHAPSYKSLNSLHSGNMLDGAYASDLSEFILDRSNISHWIHGHCHMNTDYMVGDCRIISNQRGYKGESSHTNFKGLGKIEL